jgi:hypothetical protein
MKAMTIGLSPIYNYPGSLMRWNEDSTFFASNYGASLITRAIIKQFNADYIEDFSDIEMLKNKYDTCIMSLATHANGGRDISRFTELVEKLQMKTIVISLGAKDFVREFTDYELHPSIKRLLSIASEDGKLIGVRGPYTASILLRNGFKNVVSIGCPTVFWNLKNDFLIRTKEKYENPLVVYHQSTLDINYDLIKDIDWLGQDFLDQAMFTDTLKNDTRLMNMQNTFYNNLEMKDEILINLDKHGIFHFSFEAWFEEILNRDFVFGPRLHGCIAALIQGIPAVLLVRDLRVKEMVEMFKFPSIDYSELYNKDFEDIKKLAQYDEFQETYGVRYKNYLAFLKENKIDDFVV